jgi:hypothetical protein
MSEAKMPHPNHEQHLCYLSSTGYLEQVPEAWRELVRKGRYLCRSCGRVAASKESLCLPELL